MYLKAGRNKSAKLCKQLLTKDPNFDHQGAEIRTTLLGTACLNTLDTDASFSVTIWYLRRVSDERDTVVVTRDDRTFERQRLAGVWCEIFT